MGKEGLHQMAVTDFWLDPEIDLLFTGLRDCKIFPWHQNMRKSFLPVHWDFHMIVLPVFITHLLAASLFLFHKCRTAITSWSITKISVILIKISTIPCGFSLSPGLSWIKRNRRLHYRNPPQSMALVVGFTLHAKEKGLTCHGRVTHKLWEQLPTFLILILRTSPVFRIFYL